MKKNKIKIIKIIFVVLISLLLIYILANNVFATIDPDHYTVASTIEATGATKLKDIANKIVGVLQVIGTILSVAVLVVLGIKYMIGSVEEKAEYKKSMMPYVIGAIMIFGITTILRIVVKIANALFPIMN